MSTQKGEPNGPKPGNTRTIGTYSVVGIVAVIVILLITKCLPGTPKIHPQTHTGVALPSDAQPCEQGSPSSLGYKYTCALQDSAATLQLDNVPSGVVPYLLPIDTEQQSEFEGAPTDGFDCEPVIFGNLVFGYDPGNPSPDAASGQGELVTIFKSPIKLTLGYKDADLKKLSTCEVAADEQAVLVPVFLYLYNDGETNISIWKPFQNYEADSGTATVNFKTWGDAPIGVSVIKAPKEWGPP